MASSRADEKLDACCLREYQPLPGNPRGELAKIGGITSYYIAGADQKSKGKAIVLLTDVFGMSSFFSTFFPF